MILECLPSNRGTPGSRSIAVVCERYARSPECSRACLSSITACSRKERNPVAVRSPASTRLRLCFWALLARKRRRDTIEQAAGQEARQTAKQATQALV